MHGTVLKVGGGGLRGCIVIDTNFGVLVFAKLINFKIMIRFVLNTLLLPKTAIISAQFPCHPHLMYN